MEKESAGETGCGVENQGRDPRDLPTESAEVRTRGWLSIGGNKNKQSSNGRKVPENSEKDSKEKEEQVGEEREGRRGRPTNVEKLKKERDRSRSAGSVSSWLTKRGRESDSQDSESGKEEKVGKRKKVTEIGRNKDQSAEMEKIEKLIQELGGKQEKLKEEIVKKVVEKIEESSREIERKLGQEWKKELVKMREENEKKNGEIKRENEELRKEVMELKKKEEKRERRERKRNIIIKGEQLESGTAKQVAESVCREMCGEEVKIKEAFYVGRTEKIILVEMENYEEKRKIMSNKFKLKGKEIYVDDDMSKMERDMQRKVREWAKQEKSKGKTVKVGYGKAYIGGIRYIWNNESGKMAIENFRGVGREG